MPQEPKEKVFMREKIVKPPINKRRIVRQAFLLLFFAVLFGVVAAVSFVISRPVFEGVFGSEPESPAIPITIEKDDDPSATMPSETMETSAAESTEGVVLEEVEAIVGDMINKYVWTPEMIDKVNQTFQAIGAEADKGIVTVSAVKTNVDWFDNPVESAGQYAGVILAVNANEVVIFTGMESIEGADSLRVIFGDGSTASCVVKQRDTVAEMAALSVSCAELSDSTKNWIKAIQLGNSYSLRNGDLLLAVGSPSGRVHSVKQGRVSYVAKGVQIPDGQTRVLYTDMDCDAKKGTYLLNMNGELVGWVTEQFLTEESGDVTMASPISEYKGTLQKLLNGVSMPYFGIMGQDVTESMQNEKMPQGVYVSEVIAGSPAYQAGILPGDIVTVFVDRPIISIRDFRNRLEEMESGNEIFVKIARRGIDEYKEIEYNVTIGAR